MLKLKDFFKINENGYENYRASFARVDTVFPIEGTDRLVRAVVRGRDVVLSKDVDINQLLVFVPVETSLSHTYLGANNLYRIDEYMLNANHDDVINELNNGKFLGDLTSMGGYFERNGRVKMIKIRGVYSQGYLTTIDTLIKAYPILNQFSLEEFESLDGVSFDVIGDDIFCEKYLVGGKKLVQNKVNDQKHYGKRMKNLRGSSILIPGQFQYHYDTKQFGDYYKEFRPDDDVSITVKVHGSSGIFANVLCYKRKEECGVLGKMFYWLHKPREYRLLYASRTKIRNEKTYDIVREDHLFYGSDIWGPVRDLLSPYIPQGMIVYGEICGYVEGTTKMIQKGHDYGCAPGQWKFMPYRVVEVDKKGNRKEWNIKDVIMWTKNIQFDLSMKQKFDDLSKLVYPVLLFDGPLGHLYPNLDSKSENWNLELPERMKSDKNILGMECQEPLCKMKAPREGIVIRKNNDPIPRAWKLKSDAHYMLERMSHDRGEEDVEEMS